MGRWTLPCLLAIAATAIQAASDTLYSSSVSYCSDARAIEITAFDIAYHRGNSSVSYAFSLEATESDLTVEANIYGNAYGIQVIDRTVNICDLVNGALCPLPSINFTGYGTYSIDSSIVSDIPSIAWSIPNLEAYARISLVDTTSGTEAACVIVTLSNGLSTYQPAVVIITGIFTLIAFLIALFHAGLITSPSPAQYRWYDILFLFQTAAATGMLSLNYPLLYAAFAENFHWAFALFYSQRVESSITATRLRTGGHLSGTVSSGSSISTSLGSDQGTNINGLIDGIQALQNLTSGLGSGSGLGGLTGLFKRDTNILSSGNSSTSMTQYLWPYAGISGYVSDGGIAPANALTTIFYYFLAFIAIALVFHILLFLIVLPCAAAHQEWAIRLRRTWWNFCAGNALRICLMWSFPFWIFSFYQFKLGDSGLVIFFAVLALVLTFIPLLVVFVLSLLRSRRPSTTAPGVSPLYTSYGWFHSVGTLYRPYRQRFNSFWFFLIIALIVRSAFIVFGGSWVQSIGNTAVELIIFLTMLFTRPHKDRKGDWLGAVLSFFRLCAWGLTIAFIPSINVGAIIRAIIGFVIIVIFGISTILLFLGLIWNVGYGYWWKRHNYRVEDGLEVERFVGSEPGSPDPAERHVDANNFVSGNFAEEGGIHRRASNITADPMSEYSYGNRDRYASGMSGVSQNRPTSMANPEMAYAEAADGRGQQRPMSGVSRRTSGRTAVSETAYYDAPTSPVSPRSDHGWSRDQTYDRDGRY